MRTLTTNSLKGWGSFGLAGLVLFGVSAVSLLGMQGPASATDSGIAIHRVPIENKILDTPQQDRRMSVVSPDGQWLAYSDDGTQIARYNLTTGQAGVVTVLESAQVRDLAWSPDSRSIGYVAQSSEGFTEIRVISRAGGVPRVVSRKSRAELQFNAIEWSASGATLIVQMSTNRTEDFATMSLDTGAPRIFKTIELGMPEAGRPAGPRPPSSPWILSADRRSVTLGSWTAPANRDIVSFDIETGRETSLVRHAADDFPVAWTPDGRRLLFISDRERRSALWSAEFEDGKPSGLPVQVRTPAGTAVSGSITRDGVLYLEINRLSTTDVYVSDWDPVSGRLTGPLMPAAERYAGFNSGPAWSARGDRFVVQIGEPGNPDGIDLLVRTLPADEDRIIRPQIGAFSRPRFGSDDRRVVVRGSLEPQGVGIFTIDLESGVATPLVVCQRAKIAECGAAQNPAWTPDGTRLFYELNGQSVRMLDRRTGATSEIYKATTSGQHFNAAPYDDGDRVAVADGRSLRVIEVASKASKTLLELKEPNRFVFPGSLAWTPDGKWLLFGKMNGHNGELWRISPDGGEPQFTGLVVPGRYIYFLRVRPDGRQLAFAIGDGTLPRGEIWALRNFTN